MLSVGFRERPCVNVHFNGGLKHVDVISHPRDDFSKQIVRLGGLTSIWSSKDAPWLILFRWPDYAANWRAGGLWPHFPFFSKSSLPRELLKKNILLNLTYNLSLHSARNRPWEMFFLACWVPFSCFHVLPISAAWNHFWGQVAWH